MNTDNYTQIEQENLNTLHNLIALIDSGNLSGTFAYLTNDAEFRMCMPKELPIGGVFCGHSEIQQFFENYVSLFRREWIKRGEIIVDADKIVVLGREHVCIMPGGKIYEADFANIFTFRHGKIAQWRAFGDGAALLKAYRGEG